MEKKNTKNTQHNYRKVCSQPQSQCRKYIEHQNQHEKEKFFVEMNKFRTFPQKYRNTETKYKYQKPSTKNWPNYTSKLSYTLLMNHKKNTKRLNLKVPPI